MKEILSDYLDIYQLFPAESTWEKARRKERHARLMQWRSASYSQFPEFWEVADFMKAYPDLVYEHPFFSKVLVPCLEADLENNSVDSIDFLLNYGAHKLTDQRKDYLFILSDASEWRYSPWFLIGRLLDKEPDNRAALEYKYDTMCRSIAFTVHEVPWMVLDGMNGAEKSAIPSLLAQMDEFEQLCGRLGKDQQRFVDVCRGLYHAWDGYLDALDDYTGFEDYLKQHDVPYD